MTRVALSVRRGTCLRSTKNVSCFRRKRFSAARALRERHRLRANAMASRTIIAGRTVDWLPWNYRDTLARGSENDQTHARLKEIRP